MDIVSAVYGILQKDVMEKIGMDRDEWVRLRKGRKTGDYDIIDRVVAAFPKIRPHLDLFTKQEQGGVVIPATNLYYINSKARASYSSDPANSDFLKSQPSLFIPDLGPGLHRAFEVIGNSMEPTLHHGDKVICEYSQISNDSIKNGQVYVVVTHDDVLIKRIQNRLDDRGRLVLSSDNKEDFRTYSIERKEILEMWRVRLFISYQLRDPARDYMKAQEIEADMALLREDVESEIEQLRKEIELIKDIKSKSYTNKRI